MLNHELLPRVIGNQEQWRKALGEWVTQVSLLCSECATFWASIIQINVWPLFSWWKSKCASGDVTASYPSCLLSANFTGKSNIIILIRSLRSCYLTWLVLIIACFTYQFLDILSHCPWCHPESYPWQMTLVLFENVKFIWHNSLNLPCQNHQYHHAFLCLWGVGGILLI